MYKLKTRPPQMRGGRSGGLAADAGCFGRKSVAAPGDEEFEVGVFVGAARIRLGADFLVAAFEAAMQRAEGLPFQAIGRITVRAALTEILDADAVACILLVALGTGDVHLAATGIVELLALGEIGRRRAVDLHADRSERKSVVRERVCQYV